MVRMSKEAKAEKSKLSVVSQPPVNYVPARRGSARDGAQKMGGQSREGTPYFTKGSAYCE